MKTFHDMNTLDSMIKTFPTMKTFSSINKYPSKKTFTSMKTFPGMTRLI